MAIEIVHYLEMKSPDQLVPRDASPAPLELRQAERHYPELNRFFYVSCGADWFWVDRLPWSYDDWLAYLAEPGLETWIAYDRGTPAAYFELVNRPGEDCELAMFGLLPQYTGQGLGGWLLTQAVRRAWQKTKSRVWLHTCSNDHPHALANYQARGFQLYQSVENEIDLPPETPGPWPGSGRTPRREPGAR